VAGKNASLIFSSATTPKWTAYREATTHDFKIDNASTNVLAISQSTSQVTLTATAGQQLRLGYDSTHYVDLLLTTGSGGYNQFFQITPKTAAFPNAFCGWRLQGSDFCFSYEGEDVNGQGVPNLCIRGPASSGYAASSGPGFNLYNNKSAADSKLWSMYLNDTVLTFSAINDANNIVTNWLTVNRSGSTAGSVNFPTFLNLGGSTFGANTGDIGVNGQVLVKNGSASSPGLSFGNLSTTGLYCVPASGGDIDFTLAGTTYYRMLQNELRLSSGVVVSWATGDPSSTAGDLGLSRISAQILGVKSGTNTQEMRIYGSGTVYLTAKHDGTDATVGPNSGDLILAPTGSGIIRPPTDDAYVLGTSSKRWNAALISGHLDVGNSSSTGWVMSSTAATGLTAKANHRFSHGTSALATTATEGFLHIQSCAGPPTGVPSSIPTGQIPLVWDSTNLKLYVYTGGAWKSSAAFT
jgi:hypothetical protein